MKRPFLAFFLVTWPLITSFFSYSNGDVFEGFYHGGLRKGSGSLKYSDGSRRDGEWESDRLHGFVFFHLDGSNTKVERWENGQQLLEQQQPSEQDNVIDSR